MHFPSIGPLIVVLIIVLVLFGGRGKISQVMGDFAKGIKSFKKGLDEDDRDEDEKVLQPVKTIDADVREKVAPVRRSSRGKATSSSAAKSRS